MNRLVKVEREKDIFPRLRDTPVARLLRYHNLGEAHEQHASAELLVGMCMDNRKSLRIPDNFAFVIRAGGGNLRYSEFKVSFAVAIAGVRAIALIGHTNCGMVNLMARREQFIDGLVRNAGWERERAEEHFMQFAPMFEIGNEVDFVLSEAVRLRQRYPKVLVAPMIYKVEDNLLYLVREDR
jgi:carbonic anhydrase